MLNNTENIINEWDPLRKPNQVSILTALGTVRNSLSYKQFLTVTARDMNIHDLYIHATSHIQFTECRAKDTCKSCQIVPGWSSVESQSLQERGPKTGACQLQKSEMNQLTSLIISSTSASDILGSPTWRRMDRKLFIWICPVPWEAKKIFDMVESQLVEKFFLQKTITSRSKSLKHSSTSRPRLETSK